MVDELRDLEPDTDEETEPDNRRSLFRVVIAVIVIVVISLAVLMVRGCGSDDADGGSSDGGKAIVPVQGLPAQPGAVSVWVAEGSSIDSVLEEAAVRAGDVVNMGGGRYVVTVPEGEEAAIARRLTKVNGVTDAGLVYNSDPER